MISRPWHDKAGSLGYLKGGSGSQVILLRQILESLPAEAGKIVKFATAEGDEVDFDLAEVCRTQLATSGLVERERQSWRLTSEGHSWLENQDPFFLAACFHANVRFFGELLASIEENTTQTTLLAVARNRYLIEWKTADQVRRRVIWLRDLGFVELWGTRVVLTESGKKLKTVLIEETFSPTEFAPVDESSAPAQALAPAPSWLQETILDSSAQALTQRRKNIGYIPRGTGRPGASTKDEPRIGIIEALCKFVSLAEEARDVEAFKAICADQLHMGSSSFPTAFHALKNLGAVEQVAIDRFEVTKHFKECLTQNDYTNLMRYMHTRFRFFGELLTHLHEPRSAADLQRIAASLYDFSWKDATELRIRLEFFQDAGMLDRIGWRRYRINELGRALMESLPMEKADEPGTGRPVGQARVQADVQPSPASADDFYDRLIIAATNSAEPELFERLVAEAFHRLGFRSTHLGGSGQTDVLARIELSPTEAFRLIVDAKTTSRKAVSEGAVSFDALRDHKRRHSADKIVIVGSDFEGRVIRWARDNDVLAIKVGELVELLKYHSKTAFSALTIKRFLNSANLDFEVISKTSDEFGRYLSQSATILGYLYDEVLAEGPIDAQMLRRLIPRDRRPPQEDVDTLLSLLAHPLIGAVVENRTLLEPCDTLHNVALRLNRLADALRSAIPEGE
jgi:hypothetical protein